MARHMILSSAMSQTHLKTNENGLVFHHTDTGMSVPLVCDKGHLEQGGDIEHADEESDGDGVQLGEEEDEGGGEGAGQGEQQELMGDDQDGCSIRRIRNCECSGIYLPMSLKSAANTLMSEVTCKRKGHTYYESYNELSITTIFRPGGLDWTKAATK